MKKFTTTLGTIYRHKPDIKDWKLLCKNLGTTDRDKEVSILEILEFNGVKDAYWALRCFPYRDYCLILADVIESVLPVYTKHYGEDKRIIDVPEKIRQWHSGTITEEELKIVAHTAYASYAVAAAAYTNVADAAVVAANAASYADADVIFYADSAAAADAREKQWEVNEKILRKHLVKESGIKEEKNR